LQRCRPFSFGTRRHRERQEIRHIENEQAAEVIRARALFYFGGILGLPPPPAQPTGGPVK
jgi:hypothetical protein